MEGLQMLNECFSVRKRNLTQNVSRFLLNFALSDLSATLKCA